MQRSPGVVPAVLLAAFAVFVGGCGRPTLPGQQFKGERYTSPGTVATESPLPDEPIREWGPPDAKVQVIAYYPFDDRHQRLVDLLREAAEERYPGKLYVKYVDPRTPEGLALMRRAELQVQAITINGESSVDLDSPAGVRTVDLLRDMGRYWTEDDLTKVIDQEVGKAYGREAVPSPTE
jgi:hypothetical protein